MNAKTMEGLAGASTSIGLISTPMSVVKEAERKGDIDKMQRALGYASEMNDQAGEYSKKAEQGMKLDAKEAKEQEKIQQKKLIEARREEREGQEEKIEAAKQENTDFDVAEISEEGKNQTGLSAAPSVPADEVQNVAYDKFGEAVGAFPESGEYVNVSV